MHTQSVALNAIIHAGEGGVNCGHLGGVVWDRRAGYQWVRSVTHRKSAPLSSLVRPGAGLTAELDPCFSIAADGKPEIAAARVVEEMCSNLARPEARLTSWIHILPFRPSHDTTFAASLDPSNKTCVVRQQDISPRQDKEKRIYDGLVRLTPEGKGGSSVG